MFAETTRGSTNYHLLRDLLKQGNIIQKGLGAEVGVLYGDTSQYLLQEFDTLSLLCVDPYLEYEEPGSDRTQDTMNAYEQIARDKLSEFGYRGIFIKDFSCNAVHQVADEALDFVFIDALHTYDAVYEDIRAWYPKVRTGGLVSGHDYRWKGVQEAVDEFALEIAVRGFVTPKESDIWFFVKP